MKIIMRFLIGVSFIAMSACGGGGGGGGGGDSDENELFVSIRFASPCRIYTTGNVHSSDCELEEIEGNSYVTDQSTIHLSGTVPTPEFGNCPGGDPFAPCFTYFPPYVQWINSSNDTGGNCDVPNLPNPLGPVNWNTYDLLGVTIEIADPRGIPLELGPNLIQVTARSSGSKGYAKITITRVVDVTPPKVHHVGRYKDRIAASFKEQLDPASVVNAINVFDINAQPVTGTTEYDPVKLEVVWRPNSALSPASSYIARISGVTDRAPNIMINPYQWSFKTPP